MSLGAAFKRVSELRRNRELGSRLKRALEEGPQTTLRKSVRLASRANADLVSRPELATGTHSSRRINFLAEGLKCCSTYLEIGVSAGSTLEAVSVPFKWGVDPVRGFRSGSLPEGIRFNETTSDIFFGGLNESTRFDLIFLDGLHEWKQTYTDLINSLRHSHPHTIIMIDDVVPSDKFSAIPDIEESYAAKRRNGLFDGAWHGDVYKVLVAVRRFHPELDFVCIGSNQTDNVQALLWQTGRDLGRGGLAKRALAEPACRELKETTFDVVFKSGGIPAEFGHLEEQEGLSWAINQSGCSS